MNFTATLFNPQQAHLILTKLWPQIKDQLVDGKRIEVIIKQCEDEKKEKAKHHE